MLPTKGYFQDIECPYYDSSCGRPYCHFRHRKKPVEETLNEPEKNEIPAVPTYKPTPKSELANIHNSKSHIPISYVPDLAFRPSDRTVRQTPKFVSPTYNPTPLSILSSANKRGNSILEENGDTNENTQAIKEVKQNIDNVAYNPVDSLQEYSEIKFDDLSNEFDMIDEIIGDADAKITRESTAAEHNVQQSDVNTDGSEKELTKPKLDSSKLEPREKKAKSSDKHVKNSDKQVKNSDRHGKEKSSSDKVVKSSKDNKQSSSSSSNKSHKSSSRSREIHHNKEERKDSKEKASSSSSSHRKSHKSKDRHKEREKEKKKRDEKDKNKSRDKEKRREKSSVKKTVAKPPAEESDASDDNAPMLEGCSSDFDDDEDATMLECYKIFNEYKPECIKVPLGETPKEVALDVTKDISGNKKRMAHANSDKIQCNSKSTPPPKPLNTPGQIMANRFKLAQLAQANREQDNIINEMKLVSPAVKRPAPSLLEAARQHKLKKTLPTTAKPSTGNLIDDIINGTAKAAVAAAPRRIAPVQNVFCIQRAKARLSEEMARKNAVAALNKTVAQTQKTGRVAHVPEFTLNDMPDVLHADKSKLPVNVRTRFLTMIVDECAKLYLIKQDAYTRALNEELACYEKCKVLVTYRNSAMLAVNRLRKERQEREKLGLGPLDTQEASGAKNSQLQSNQFYKNVKRWLLTEDELDLHGYPRESAVPGHALIKNRKKTSIGVNLDDNQRKCSRCSKIYLVDDDGWPLYEEECVYHPLKKRTIRGEQTYLCCRVGDDTGCATSETHVCDLPESAELEGYQTTMEPEVEDDPRSQQVYALDCEMCYTTRGLELTRVTIVDTECKTVYESLVKPLNPIIDYNTRFSGITQEQMDKTSTSILQIQANILHLCNSKTILVGHSLESDMKALKIVHGSVIDTSVLFPHRMGLPHKRALRVLASEYLKKLIQNDVGGHDSAEDAITCMDLIKWKLKEELKVRGNAK